MTFLASIITANIFDGIKKALDSFAADPKFVKEAYEYAVDHRLLDDPDNEEKFPAHLKSLYRKAGKLLAKELHFEGGKLQIWRAITVKDPEQYLAGLKQGKYGSSKHHPDDEDEDYTGLGIFWSWRYEKSMPTPGGNPGGKIILKALVGLDAIDLKGTALRILDVSDFFHEEKEIRLKENAKIELLDVLDSTGKSVLDGPPISLVAKTGSLLARVGMVTAAKTITVYRAVKDILPEQIDDRFHGKGVFGDGTYYALDEKTAFRYASGEFSSVFKKFAIIIAYKMQVQNPLTLTPKIVDGLENNAEWLSFKDDDEDAENFGLPSSFERDRLSKLAKENEFDAIILKGPPNTVDGENQILVPVGSSVKLTRTNFSVLVGSDMASLNFSRELKKKLGGEEWADYYNGVTNIPISKLKELTPLLKGWKSK